MANPYGFDFSVLTPAERILLAESLWDSVVESQENLSVTPEQEAELERRCAAEDAGEMPSSSWPEVRKRLQPKA